MYTAEAESPTLSEIEAIKLADSVITSVGVHPTSRVNSRVVNDAPPLVDTRILN